MIYIGIIGALICTLFACIFLFGKEPFLVRLYDKFSILRNTTYSIKKVSYVLGIGLLILAALFLSLYFFAAMALRLFMAITITIISIPLLILKMCKPSDSSSTSQLKGTTNTISVVMTGIILVLCGILMFSGSVTIKIQETAIDISVSLWPGKKVAYQDIKAIAYIEELEIGKRTFGVGTNVVSAGDFRNDQFGEYLLYAYHACDHYIVLTTKTGMIVFNAESIEDTKLLYEAVLEQTDL